MTTSEQLQQALEEERAKIKTLEQELKNLKDEKEMQTLLFAVPKVEKDGIVYEVKLNFVYEGETIKADTLEYHPKKEEIITYLLSLNSNVLVKL